MPSHEGIVESDSTPLPPEIAFIDFEGMERIQLGKSLALAFFQSLCQFLRIINTAKNEIDVNRIYQQVL